jgi:flavin-dependent dehydrogenase
LKGTPPPIDGVSAMYGPRRTVLDKILLDAAAEAGAEVAEGYTVTGVTSEDGRVTGIRGHRRNGPEIEEQARIVIGADGRHSVIAKAVGADEYNVRPVLNCGYYSFWRNVPPNRVTVRVRPRRFLVSSPTNDGLTIAVVLFPIDEFETVKTDVEKYFMASVDLVPELSELLRQGERAERFYGGADLMNFFRKPYGDGWALAGDAGYHKDPITAQGISDAFTSVEWLAEAIDAGLSGRRPMEEALAEYQRVRDAHLLPMYDLTNGLANLVEPPPPHMQALLAALQTNQAETDRFMGTLAGTVSIPQFFSPENVGRIMAKAASAGTG